MANVFKGLLKVKWMPQIENVRYRSHPNITRPRAPNFKRALVETVCKPIVPSFKAIPKHLPRIHLCKPEEKVDEELTEYEAILAKEALNWISSTKLVAFFHVNFITNDDLFQNRLVSKKNGFRHLRYTSKIMQSALKGTKYEAATILFKSHNIFIVSEEPDIHKLLKLTPKLKNLALMAAIVEDRFFSLRELQYYGEFQNIEQARIKLLGTLNAASQNLVQNLNYHPNNFVQMLSAIQEQKKDNKDS